MNGFVPKPIERAHLLQEMARVLGRGGRIAGSPTRAGAGRMTFDRHGALLRWDEDWLTLAGMLDQFFQQYRGVSEQLRLMLRGGGSIPIVTDFQDVLKTPSVMMGFGLPDDNLHAPNEKFHLANFYRGIESIIEFMHEVAA